MQFLPTESECQVPLKWEHRTHLKLKWEGPKDTCICLPAKRGPDHRESCQLTRTVKLDWRKAELLGNIRVLYLHCIVHLEQCATFVVWHVTLHKVQQLLAFAQPGSILTCMHSLSPSQRRLLQLPHNVAVARKPLNNRTLH